MVLDRIHLPAKVTCLLTFNSLVDILATVGYSPLVSFNSLGVCFMARRRSATLTDGEARLMRVLWDKETATVADVAAQVKSNYSTVQTMLRILESKGYVTHEKSGRAFAYRAVVDQKQARRRALSHLVSGLFNNSPSLLVLNVLEDARIDPRELDRLKQLIKDSE
jgi:BlaI family transcriptional regulator, penicillinase repressor